MQNNIITIFWCTLLHIGIILLLPLFVPYCSERIILMKLLNINWKETCLPIRIISFLTLVISFFLFIFLFPRICNLQLYPSELTLIDLIFNQDLIFIPIVYMITAILLVYPILKLFFWKNRWQKLLLLSIISHVPVWTIIAYIYFYYCYTIMMWHIFHSFV